MSSTGNMQAPVQPNFMINSVSITVPSNVQWQLPKAWDIDGGGFERLEPFGSAVLTWNHMSYTDYTTLRSNWDLISGTATITLPSLYGTTLDWMDFASVIIDMPRPENPYFEGNHSNVKMTVRRVNIVKR